MGILLPNDVDWSPANWVARALFTDLLEQGDPPAQLVEALRFCIEAELDTLDLRAATTADLAVLRTLVEVVLDHSIALGPSSFQLPEFHPVYLEKLRALSLKLDQGAGPSRLAPGPRAQ